MTAVPTFKAPVRRAIRRGFSLIEILVSVGLVGIALAISVPRIARMRDQAQVQRAAQLLQAQVQQAFAIAGRNRVPIRLSWKSAVMELQVTNVAGDVVYRRAGIGAGSGLGMNASNVLFVPTNLTVFPNGLANDSLVIVVARSDFRRTVRFARSGMVLSR
jgi:prepilin-type N-terminal cleavage/methylation domain-containing protein